MKATYIKGLKYPPRGWNIFLVKENNPYYKWYLENDWYKKGKTIEI